MYLLSALPDHCISHSTLVPSLVLMLSVDAVEKVQQGEELALLMKGSEGKVSIIERMSSSSPTLFCHRESSCPAQCLAS